MDVSEVFAGFARRPIDAARHLPVLTSEQLNMHPAAHPNSVAWLLWHTGREVDVQLADLSGEAQQWEVYRSRFDLGELGETVGYGHTAEQSAQIKVDEQRLLVDYLEATLTALIDYASRLPDSAFDEIVDRNWDPPVTRGQRLISIIDDAAQHVGQAAYASGALILSTGYGDSASTHGS
ncbi:DinB family protein [Aeromicrobium wangtongii]|uniref:DinB family protein n=1 Tax=Aeromicrobium wangtongii TaxID=2969247 RepID=UPI00201792DA|nr:DinB family protein [Aeromicrobium wangtongii]MCL3817943.1 DinB family protein [Aeromicrobium wangtongii]